MDLKSNSTFWMRLDPSPLVFPPLDHDLHCAVAIIGGGVTGALVAHHLIDAGIETVLIDRGPLCHGSTSASTGLLQYELDASLCDLIKTFGRKPAFRAYQLCFQALHKIRYLIETQKISCDLTAKESLFLAAHPHESADFEQEWQARQACGISLELLSPAQITERFSFTRPAALLSPLALEIDPYQFARQLLVNAHRRGLALFAETAAVQYLPDDAGVTLRTNTGFAIRAKKIVFATGNETPEFLRLHVQLHTTFALVTQPLSPAPGWYHHCLIWESARPYLYARTTADSRAIIGGEDIPHNDPALRDALLPQKIAALTQKFSALFPHIPITPQFAWAGTFAQTPDGLPYIGPSRQFPHGLFALGYGGNGILFSLIAAELLRDAFLQRPTDDAPLFRFDR